jgi:hypothetical protein
VLDGLPLQRGHASHVQAAVQQEMTRLLSLKGIAPELHGGVAMPHAQGSNMQFANEASPRQLGTQIAQSVNETLMPQKSAI